MMRRYILNIKVNSVAVHSKVVLDVDMVAKGIQSLLTGNRIPNEKIVKTTACSDATASNFHGITAIDRELNIEGSTFQETLSFPCFHFNEKPKRSGPRRRYGC